MWTYEELMLVVDYAIRKYNLSIPAVIKELEADIAKRKQRGKQKQKPA